MRGEEGPVGLVAGKGLAGEVLGRELVQGHDDGRIELLHIDQARGRSGLGATVVDYVVVGALVVELLVVDDDEQDDA